MGCLIGSWPPTAHAGVPGSCSPSTAGASRRRGPPSAGPWPDGSTENGFGSSWTCSTTPRRNSTPGEGGTVDDAEAVPLTDTDLAEIEDYLERLERVPDSKFDRLSSDLHAARGSGRAIIVFTQFTDTLDYLRDRLHASYRSHLATYSGSGGQQWTEDEGWVQCLQGGTGGGFDGRTGVGAPGHRCSQRRSQPPGRERPGELRPAVEPDAGRAAHRPHRPHRPARADRHRCQLRGAGNG